MSNPVFSEEALEAAKAILLRKYVVINRYTYKGRGRPKKSDYTKMDWWQIERMHSDTQAAKIFERSFSSTYIPVGKPLCAQKHYFNNSSGASS